MNVRSLLGVSSLPAMALAVLPTLAQTAPATVFGYTDFTAESKVEKQFLDVPDAKLAGQHLKTLTAEPHIAASPEDHKTAEYVAEKFRAAGLETEIVPFRVLMNQPKVVKVEAFDSSGKLLISGPAREHVDGDPGQDDPRVVMPFNGSSGSGDVTGEVVYANYGRLEDFAVEVNVLGGELVEVLKAAVVGVDHFSGEVAGAGGAVEGHDYAGIVLVGVAGYVLGCGAGDEQFAAGVPGFYTDGFGVVDEDAVGDDFSFQAGGAEFLGDVIGGFAVFRGGGEVGHGGEDFEVLAGEFGIGDGEEFLFDAGLGGEVLVAEDGGWCGLG